MTNKNEQSPSHIDWDKVNPSAVVEFFAEAEHGNWDGWDKPKDRAVIFRLVSDMRIWLENHSQGYSKE